MSYSLTDLLVNTMGVVYANSTGNANPIAEVLKNHANSQSVKDGSGWIPNCDEILSKKYHCICLELPGVMKSDIKLRIEGSTVIVSGIKRNSDELLPGIISSFNTGSSSSMSSLVHVDTLGDTKTLNKGRTKGVFEKKISLPIHISSKESVKTKYEDGILYVIIDKETIEESKISFEL